MVKIKLLTLMAGPQGVFQPHSVIEVTQEEATAFIDGHFAELVEGALPPVDEVKPAEIDEDALRTVKITKRKGVKNG